MAWSIFTTGGGTGAAATYAKDLLASEHLPQSKANLQFVYDWERSEGGGGANNPLNVGPVGTLASSGSQYGGGAANYPTIAANIQAVGKELNTPTYAPIKTALAKSTYQGAANALWRSNWAADHYGYGKSWSSAGYPSETAPIQAATGATLTAFTLPGGMADPLNWFTGAAESQLTSDLGEWVLRGILIIFGAILIVAALKALADQGKTEIETPPGDHPEEGEKAEGAEEGEEAEAAEAVAA